MPPGESIVSDLARPIIGGALYLPPGTAARITSYNAASGVRVSLQGWILGTDGVPRPFALTHAPNTDRTLATDTVVLGDGWLLCAHVVATAGSPRRGQCFVRVQLTLGHSSISDAFATVLQGYVVDTLGLAFPGSPVSLSTDGPGVIRTVTGTNPAAGAEFSETVPTNARWRLISLYAQLVTGAAVANREPALVIDDGATNVHASAVHTSQAASLTHQHVWSINNQRAAMNVHTVHPAPLPDGILMGGYRIRSSTANIQAADDYAAPLMLVEEWIED